jgi:hypothetical protein
MTHKQHHEDGVVEAMVEGMSSVKMVLGVV